MPSHPDRARSAPLPEGYQFGDGRPVEDCRLVGGVCACESMCAKVVHGGPTWRAPHLNAAERIANYQREYETPSKAQIDSWVEPALRSSDASLAKRGKAYETDYSTSYDCVTGIGIRIEKPFIVGRDLGDEA